MVNVAILGGTGHVGRTVVEALKEHPSHFVIILGRKAPAVVDSQVPFVEAAYSNVGTLTSVFEQYKIHTVISCLLIENDKVSQSQANAIEAADRSKTTKRFIASNWATPADPSNPWSQYQVRAQEHLGNTSLIWTEVCTGYFLDFWGLPFLKSHMGTTLIAIDIKNRFAGIPGTGNEHISFAYSFDVARFIAERLLDLPSAQWERATIVLGDRLTWNQFLVLAEEARGSKFEVHYDTEAELAEGKLTELPNHVESYGFFPKESLRYLYATLGHVMALGGCDIPLEESTNRRLSPDFKTLTVKEMLGQTWKANPEAFS